MKKSNEHRVLDESNTVLNVQETPLMKLITDYLGDDKDDPLYREKLNKLDEMISGGVMNKVIGVFRRVWTADALATIKNHLAEPANWDMVKQYLTMANEDLKSYDIHRENLLKTIPGNVWDKHIFPKLNKQDLVSFAKSCRYFRHKATPTYSKPALLHLVKKNKMKEVRDLLPLMKLNCFRGCTREYSPFYIAAMNRNKPMYDLLVSNLPLENQAVYELMYYVISNLGEMRGNEWKFNAESFVRQRKMTHPYLIFEPGPEGLSLLQIAAINDDIHMLLALLKPLINNSEKLELLQISLLNNNALNSEAKWNLFSNTLLEELPTAVQNLTLRQLQAAKENEWLINAGPYTHPYEVFRKSGSKTDWGFLRPVQEVMPLHARADVYFHSHGSNSTGHCPNYYEFCGSREFKFGFFTMDASWMPSWMMIDGPVCISRGASESAGWAVCSVPQPGDYASMDSGAVTRLFEVRSQQLEKIISTLQLLQQTLMNQ